MRDSTERFSTRVDNYVKFRPDYPLGVTDILKNACGLTSSAVIADVGSGTGIFSKKLLAQGFTVIGVEPNREMREAGEHMLNTFKRFKSLSGQAEATTLPANSVDAITSAQAVHWFDREKTHLEFKRILKPDGVLFFLWNNRLSNTTTFLRQYESLLKKYGTDYLNVDQNQTGRKQLAQLFGNDSFKESSFNHHQEFDYEGLKGRLLSSSYSPEPGHPKYLSMQEELRRLFDEFNENNAVVFEYETKVYYGHITAC